MTIRQLIHSGPAKANELFAKLAETSDGAVRTREKLFLELKAELELLAGLEETHLFPALRKHQETKELVAGALADNQQVRALLTELERMPKGGEDFPSKTAELKKVFQQHVRDEKRELLPAVGKALSEEEAQTVVERIEAGKAEAEEAKREETERQRAEARREREREEADRRKAEEERRQEAEKRRAEAKREREEAERRRAAAEAAERRQAEAKREHEEETERRKAEAEAAERHAREAAAAAVRPAEIAAQGGLRVVEAEAEALTRNAQQAADLAGQAVQQTAGSAAGAVRRYHEATAEVLEAERALAGLWLELASEQMRQNVEIMGKLAAARAWPEALEVQNAFVRDSLDRMNRLNGRYLETVQVVLRAATAGTEERKAAAA
jgi:hypothetical protein